MKFQWLISVFTVSLCLFNFWCSARRIPTSFFHLKQSPNTPRKLSSFSSSTFPSANSPSSSSSIHHKQQLPNTTKKLSLSTFLQHRQSPRKSSAFFGKLWKAHDCTPKPILYWCTWLDHGRKVRICSWLVFNIFFYFYS